MVNIHDNQISQFGIHEALSVKYQRKQIGTSPPRLPLHSASSFLILCLGGHDHLSEVQWKRFDWCNSPVTLRHTQEGI